MDDQWISSSGSQSDAVEQLAELQRSQDALWIQLRSEDDPERRMALLSQFGENRSEIERLSSGLAGGQTAEDGAGTLYRVEIVEPPAPSPPELSGVGDHPSEERERDEAAGDPSSGPVGPLSFDETGDLVASNGHGGSSEPFLDLQSSEASPTHANGDGAGGDDRGAPFGGPGGLAESVFGLDRLGRSADPMPSSGEPSFGEPSFGGDVNGERPPDEPPGVEDALAGHDMSTDDGALSHSASASANAVVDGFGADDGALAGSPPAPGDRALEDEPVDDAALRDAALDDAAFDAALSDDPADIDADVLAGAFDSSAGGVFGVGAHESRPEAAQERPYGTERRDEADRPGADRERASHAGAADVYRDSAGQDDGRNHVDDVDEVDDVGHPRHVGPRVPMARVGPPRAAEATAGPAPTSQYPAVAPRSSTPRQRSSSVTVDPPHRALLLLGGLVLVLGVSWLVLTRGSDDAPTSAASEQIESSEADQPAGPTADLEIGEIVVALRNVGLDGVTAERRGDIVALTGSVPTEADRGVAVGIARSVAPDATVDGAELIVVAGVDETQAPQASAPDVRGEAFQGELRRIVAATPIIFELEQTAITDLHARILNSVASIMSAYPELRVTVIGFADGTGTDDSNVAISLQRAESVKAYLVGVGVAEDRLVVDARGEVDASGSQALANLERRVEFEVEQTSAPGATAADAAPIRIAIVAPSAQNDLAFTQSMVDAANVLAAERGNVEVAVTDGTFVPEEAASAIRGYAAEGYDLVIAHGSQFGNLLIEIAPEFPETAFAWGTASDTFGLPNVYAYDAAAQQGGYVMGSMSTMLSSTGVVGVVGPIEVGDAQLYVNGFDAGARATKPDATVLISYTDSFSDLTLASEAARSHVGSGADVMTGSAQMVVGAVSVAEESGALWFGTQANQTSLAPSLVVASQVYHWEVILRQIVAEIDGGRTGGQSYTANLANGGLVIEYNPDYPLPPEVRARGDEVTAAIVNGTLTP